MSVEQTLDQVGIAWPATAGAYGQLASELGFGGRGEGRGLLIADMYPFESVGTSDRIDNRVEAISDNAVDALYSGLPEHLYELLRYRRHARRAWVQAQRASCVAGLSQGETFGRCLG